MSSYLDLCRKAVEEAIKLGASEAEALVFGGRTMGSEIERGQIKSCNDITDVGIAVRAILNGSIGFAFTNILTEESAKEMANRALKAAKSSPRDENWRSLPSPKPYPSVPETYDRRVEELTSDTAVELSQRAIEAAVGAGPNVLPAFGGTQVQVVELFCVNSHGVEVYDKGTAVATYLAAMARKGAQVSPMCFEFSASRKYEVDPEWVGKEAGSLAVKSTEVGPAESGKFKVLLDPFALQSILTYTFVEAIKGDNVYRGKSAYKNKVGEEVASEILSIYDDGTLPGGLYSAKADLEGVPCQRTPIIERGVLSGFIYDNYWAKLVGKESTGNARRGGGGLGLPGYGTVPSINPTNIVIEPGDASEEELISEVKDGYYIREVQGAHQSNPETGEFSVALAPAFRIKEGRITHAVKGVMMAGNAYEMLKKIVLMGKEARQVGNFVTPKVVVEGMTIIAK
ncbi:MAG: hypothetical protein DRO05_07525 [Thermoproteota archaeon]|nr:MAG: hypothetical protein DRO05_07525 [Candidatus Korarchaeota archaeon]